MLLLTDVQDQQEAFAGRTIKPTGIRVDSDGARLGVGELES